MPVGNPAPPRPRRPERSIWASSSSGSVAAARSAMAAAIAAGNALHGAARGGEEPAESLFTAGASLYARLAVAKLEGDHAEIAKLEDELRYCVCDPLWVEIMIQFEASRTREAVDSYPRHQQLDDFVMASLPNEATVALIADWATGTPSARALLEQVASFRPDVVI